MNCLLAVVGPTGTGKTSLAVSIAQKFNGEIIGADSRQVYRYMDIGTAKPSFVELATVPHHIIDIILPNHDFSLAQYQELANKAIKDIQSRNRLPLLVGGTGQYIWGVIEGWEIPRVEPDLQYRQEMERRAETGENLYKKLTDIDPEAAVKIDPRNVRRVIRALEVYHRAGERFSWLKRKKSLAYNTLVIGLTAERSELYCRIDSRVDDMINNGLVAEVEDLLTKGYDFTRPAMSGIGYRQIGMYLRNEISLEEAVKQVKTETHRFVRHQYNWFKLKDERIHWFDVSKDIEGRVTSLISEFMGICKTG
ncbi:tRNA (adenosine(37)-N6)-dimethylallyltransferase MiaA [Chloroflexota bacterium]